VEPRRAPWVSRATRDAIRHYAWGIGDDNPLWTDRAHASSSRWGGLIAPPCFHYAVHETTVAPNYPERRRVYRTVDWRFFDVVPVGTSIEARASLIDEREANGELDQYGRVEFNTADGSALAVALTRCSRSTDAAVPIDARPEVRYSGDELNAIEHSILTSERRGTKTRTWEAIAPGDELGPLIKGPLSIMDVVAWCAATTGMVTTDEGHSDGGLQDQCATGPEQVAWMSQLVTDWMSDDAFLLRLQVELKELASLGTTTTIAGKVTAVELDGDRPVVRIELWATDQSGTVTARGSATVLHPSTRYGPVRLPIEP
jgi:acyl dehydratase